VATNIKQMRAITVRIGRLQVTLLGILTASCLHRAGPSASSLCLEDRRPVGFQSVLTVVPGAAATAVEGVVLAREANTPLPEAGVWIDPPNGPTTRTAADGRFTFGDVAPGRHAVLMRRIGYKSLRDSITVPVAGQLRIEAQQSMLDGGCEGLGEVRTANP
jgi:carboxypeptidase family protein